MGFINCQEGNFNDVFVTETEIVDRFVGNQLWNWGYAGTTFAGILGNNLTTSRSSPVQTVSTGTNWKQVSNKTTHTAAVKTDGTLWLWGSTSAGQLGTNSTVDHSSPVQTVSTGTNWKEVRAGLSRSAATKTDGTLWLWGLNNNGSLGNNTSVNQSSPVQTVSTGTNWKQIYSGTNNVAAVKTDGTLWIWGNNAGGSIGNNNTSNQSSPVQTVSTGTNWKQVSLGQAHSAAIKTDGTLWTWGCGITGSLGNNGVTNHSSPVQTISTGTNWKTVSAGRCVTASIKIDGTLWLWGAGTTGKLGNNNIINQSSPVQTVSTGTNWKQVSSSDSHSAAIKTDGTLWVWGTGAYLGINSTIRQSSPVQTVSSGTNWKQISVGEVITTAVTFTKF